jgi:hypothetical protein
MMILNVEFWMLDWRGVESLKVGRARGLRERGPLAHFRISVFSFSAFVGRGVFGVMSGFGSVERIERSGGGEIALQ